MMPGLPGLRGYDTATTVAMSKEEASVFLSFFPPATSTTREPTREILRNQGYHWQWVWAVALDAAVIADLVERRVARTYPMPSVREDHSSP